MEERTRLIDEIVKSKGYKVALFTTFNFEIEFFERAILNQLYDNGIRQISLFVDDNEFNEALSQIDPRTFNLGLGRKYVVSPVAINGAFHPKLVLLLGDKKAKLIVASANIKTSGYERNNEIFNVVEYSEKDTTYQDVIAAAIDCFLTINRISFSLDNELVNDIKEFVYYRKRPLNGERFLVTNCELPIIDQIKDKISNKITDIKIAVPYYDNKVSALKEIKQLFPEAKMELYIQQGTSTYPKEYADEYKINLFDKFLDAKGANGGSFYHGKVFLFKSAGKDYILYGSANCTASALIKTYSTNGNIEADILDVGDPGEFDTFFENMGLIKGQEIDSKPIIYKIQESVPIRFVCAELVQSGVECRFEYEKDLKNIVFSYKDKVFECKKSEHELAVVIDKEQAELMPRLFDLSVSCDKGDFVIRCWVIDRFALSTNRKENQDKNCLDTFEYDSDGTKFREDRINILKAELMCSEEVLDHRKKQAYIRQQEIMDEEDDETGSDEDFVVESELHYEYKAAIKSYQYVERIRSLFLQRFLSPITFHDEKKEKNDTKAQDETSADNEYKVLRKPTTEEKSFERFVKRRVKGMMTEEFNQAVSLDHYLGISRVITGIFDKYRNVSLFDVDYVVLTKTSLIYNLLQKDMGNLEDAKSYEEHLVVWALCIILDNRMMIEARHIDNEYKMDSADKKLLEYLDKNFEFRKNIGAYIKKAADKSFNSDYQIIEKFGPEYVAGFIEKQYGYKTEEQLVYFIKTRYGDDAEVYIEKGDICIKAKSDNMVKHLRPDLEVSRQVLARMRNAGKKWNNLIIIIENNNMGKSKNIVRIKHRLTLDIYRKWSQTIEYLDGKKNYTASMTYY